MRLKGAKGHRGDAANFLAPWVPVSLLCPQKCIDWNREMLKRELGLTERDIVDIPQLFILRGSLAEAFFPDMVRAEIYPRAVLPERTEAGAGPLRCLLGGGSSTSPSLVLNQGDFAPSRGGGGRAHFDCRTRRGLLTSSGWRPPMLLNIPQVHTADPHN